MDDSEKSYGYSEDIYHGSHGRDAEKSYEYGAENSGDSEGSELSPEEDAMHIEGAQAGEEPVASGDAGEYDHGRGSEYEGVESFTWDLNDTGSLDNRGKKREPVGEEVGVGRSDTER